MKITRLERILTPGRSNYPRGGGDKAKGLIELDRVPEPWFPRRVRRNHEGCVVQVEKGVSLFTRTNQLRARSKAFLGSLVVASTLVVSLGVAVQPSGALSSSAFCKTIYTWKPVSPPSSFTTTGYHKWALEYLPIYEKLASEAPNAATKNILNAIVKILTYYSTAGSAKALEAYALANAKTYQNDAQALAKAIIACA